MLLVTGGRLGDIFGRRRAFLFGVVMFAGASATAGLAPSEGALVLSRVASADRTEVVLADSYHVATLDHDAEEIERRAVEFALRVTG